MRESQLSIKAKEWGMPEKEALKKVLVEGNGAEGAASLLNGVSPNAVRSLMARYRLKVRRVTEVYEIEAP